MYVPAENIYYETIIKEEPNASGSFFRRCSVTRIKKCVVPVSPNSLYVYLQTISLGLRGMKVEENAQEILGMLERLKGDINKMQDNFRVLGGHLTRAHNAYTDSEKELGKFEIKLAEVERPAQLADHRDESPNKQRGKSRH